MITAIPEIIVTMASAHVRRIDRASARRIRKMTQDAVTRACNEARSRGARPITAVDDLSVYAIGPWIAVFAKCLARSAKRERISIIGGEMAQMPDTYAAGYAGIVVSVAAIRGL